MNSANKSLTSIHINGRGKRLVYLCSSLLRIPHLTPSAYTDLYLAISVDDADPLFRTCCQNFFVKLFKNFIARIFLRWYQKLLMTEFYNSESPSVNITRITAHFSFE